MKGLIIQKTDSFSKVRAGAQTLLIIRDQLVRGYLPELGSLIEFEEADLALGQTGVKVILRFKSVPDDSYSETLCALFEKPEFLSFELHEIGPSLIKFEQDNSLTYQGFTSHKGRQRFLFKKR